MSLIKCSECRKEISDRANVCPNCGCPISNNSCSNESSNIINSSVNPKDNRKIYMLIGGIVLVILIATITIFLLNKPRNGEEVAAIQTEEVAETTTEAVVEKDSLEGIWIRKKDDKNYSDYSGMAIQVSMNDGYLEGKVISTPCDDFPVDYSKWTYFKKTEENEYTGKDTAIVFDTNSYNAINTKITLSEDQNTIKLICVDAGYENDIPQTWVRVTESDMQSTIDLEKCLMIVSPFMRMIISNLNT